MYEVYVMNHPLKFVNNRIDEYALKVTYIPEKAQGDIIYNLSIIREDDIEDAIVNLKNSYNVGLCVSDRVRFIKPGETIDKFTMPDGNVGICTMCSITLDALLLKRGVPVHPIGGGVVEIEQRIPRRFTDIIRYEHTTIDPLQVLLSQEITNITSVMTQGNGSILANIRECNMEAESIVVIVLDQLTEAGFTGILDVGIPNAPLLGIPVRPEYFGIALVGGTNPIAAFKESGKWVQTIALKGLMDIQEMGSIEDL